MISDKQYHREKKIEIEGFWLGVRVTLYLTFLVALSVTLFVKLD